MSVEDDIRTFIVEELNFAGPVEGLNDTFPLIENHVVDSVGIFQIVSFIEERYGIAVDDTELLPDNFKDLASIAGLVRSKEG